MIRMYFCKKTKQKFDLSWGTSDTEISSPSYEDAIHVTRCNAVAVKTDTGAESWSPESALR